jgi:hypothetical protein
MALAGQLLGSKAETSRTNRELKLRGGFHRRCHAIGVLGSPARRGVPFSPTRRAFDKLPLGETAGAFSSPPREHVR